MLNEYIFIGDEILLRFLRFLSILSNTPPIEIIVSCHTHRRITDSEIEWYVSESIVVLSVNRKPLNFSTTIAPFG